MPENFDFAIAGSGAAGCALAERLSSGGARVLLIEKGGPAKPGADAFEAVYRYYTRAGLSASLGNCLLPIPTGTALGGTTTINSATCLKTPDETLERWEMKSGGGFSAGEFRSFLEQAWRRLLVKTAPVSTMSASSRIFLKGLEAMGLEGGQRLDRAEDGCVGSGFCCFVCPEDAKMTAEKAFLRRPAAGLEIAVHAGLESIREQAAGVRIRLRGAGGARRDALCGRLVLACGSLATPYFVRRFGLGPRWAAAGNELSLHPASKAFALFDEPVRSWSGVPQGAGWVDPREPLIRYEGVYTPPEMAAVTMPLEGRELAWWLSRYDKVATFGFMIRDRSRGSVRYPAGPGFPLIRYDLGPEDVRLMVRAMRFVGRAFLAAGARRVVLPINRAGNSFDDAAALEREEFPNASARELQMMAFHPLGTCGAGRVAGWDLALTDRIFICDGSVVPESLGVNPQITIYAFALRLAERLLGRVHAG